VNEGWGRSGGGVRQEQRRGGEGVKERWGRS